MRVLIIGGTGQLSTRITEAAVAHGHDVTVITRGRRAPPSGLSVRMLTGERNALRDIAGPLAELEPEAIVDSICYTPEQARQLVSLFPKARRVVMVSTVDVYGQDVGGEPVTEERAPGPVTPYAIGKAASERVVLEGLGSRATVVRPSHILGRGFLTASLWGRNRSLVARLQAGKPILAIDGGRNLMTPVHALDIAEWIMRTLDATEADGEIFNVVGGESVTQRAYYECVASILGVEARIVAVPSPVFRSVVETPAQFNWHRSYSCAKAVARLGYRPAATLRSMLEETVGAMLASADGAVGYGGTDEMRDDALAELLLRHEAELRSLLASKSATGP